MITKKTSKVSLENKKGLFFEIGLTLALAAVLVAFEWASPEHTNTLADLGDGGFSIEEVQIPVTRTKEIMKVKPPEAIEIKIIPNDPEIPDDPIDWNSDAGEETEIPLYTYEEEVEVGGDPVYFADQMPTYRGGDLNQFRAHMQEIVDYPQTAIDLDLQGKVFVQFVINQQGELVDIEIVKGIDPILDNAVIAALRKSEKWEPGEQSGRKVKVAMNMPIVFKLNR